MLFKTNHHDKLTKSLCQTTSVLMRTWFFFVCVVWYFKVGFRPAARTIVKGLFFVIKYKRHTPFVNTSLASLAFFKQLTHDPNQKANQKAMGGIFTESPWPS